MKKLGATWANSADPRRLKQLQTISEMGLLPLLAIDRSLTGTLANRLATAVLRTRAAKEHWRLVFGDCLRPDASEAEIQLFIEGAVGRCSLAA